ncbi:hypothetical protein [Aliiroseovarius crassostreae]|uniref:hypothetical protein n=1 Tax=Aliiroseovarius crassostreae TaxID=154981 RepID=UPI00220089D2|nr:hypothetical protein [Aliiroseovarius crassostreae]UWP90195.1 hypothetical protein K3J57_05870 [Aliiroseovarius crassostreae]
MSDQTRTTAGIHQDKVFEGHILACTNDWVDTFLSVSQKTKEIITRLAQNGSALISAAFTGQIAVKARSKTDTTGRSLVAMMEAIDA